VWQCFGSGTLGGASPKSFAPIEDVIWLDKETDPGFSSLPGVEYELEETSPIRRLLGTAPTTLPHFGAN
jgi:hypothetical protein